MPKQKIKENLAVKTKLPSSLKLGSIELNVKDISLMKDFYHNIMGFEIINETPNQIVLGKNNSALLKLNHTKHLSYSAQNHAGLYHLAVVFASRGDLARMIYNVISKNPDHFSGSADHLVSEAFYFTDPEGNGIELYYDRDRSLWQWENNSIKMATIYIDPAEYLRNNLVLEDTQKEITMGHFHLKVGDIKKAKEFYVDILGFDVTAELPGALFISVGGYHHHIGLNTWESKGAPLRNQTLGLEKISIILPDKHSFDELKLRLLNNDISFKESNNSLLFSDPWNNKIEVY